MRISSSAYPYYGADPDLLKSMASQKISDCLIVQEKFQKLKNILAGYGQVAVAFSGGADSSLLLWSALQLLGRENILVLSAVSCLIPAAERKGMQTWFARHGVQSPPKHLCLDPDPLNREAFITNPSDRCYICKTHTYRLFLEIAARYGIALLADGTNRDDLNSHRPGLRTIRELNIRTPLAEAGLDKQEIRLISRAEGLDTWESPSSSCLATRIPAGMSITAERLELIASLEANLREKGFSGCRVRLDRFAPSVCIEVAGNDIQRISDPDISSEVIDYFMKNGIKHVFLNLQGR